MAAISSSTTNSTQQFLNSQFTNFIYGDDVQVAWEIPAGFGQKLMGEITFNGTEGAVHKRSVYVANTKSKEIEELAVNIDRLDPQDRRDLAASFQGNIHISKVAELVIDIGLKSANADARNHFLSLKQEEEKMSQTEQQKAESSRQEKLQKDLLDAYQDGAFKGFYDSDNALLSTETRVDLSINYSESVIHALSDGQHPNHSQFTKAAADILRKKAPTSDLFSSLKILIERNNYSRALLERCLKEYPEN